MLSGKDGHLAWRPMTSAPRDGTVIEIECCYGVAPWYGPHRWGKIHSPYERSAWISAEDPRRAIDPDFVPDRVLRWRPVVAGASKGA